MTRTSCAFAYAWALGTATFASGCAFDVISIKQEAATFTPASDSTQGWTLTQLGKVRLVQGFATDLKPGTKWRQVGHIQQGDVFHTSDQVVAVEASNQHEADLVVSGGKAVGFYLIVEHTFAAADPPLEIQTSP